MNLFTKSKFHLQRAKHTTKHTMGELSRSALQFYGAMVVPGSAGVSPANPAVKCSNDMGL